MGVDSQIRWLKMLSATEPTEVVAQNMVSAVVDALNDAGLHDAAQIFERRLGNTVPLIQALQMAAEAIVALEKERAVVGITFTFPGLPWKTPTSNRHHIARMLHDMGAAYPRELEPELPEDELARVNRRPWWRRLLGI